MDATSFLAALVIGQGGASIEEPNRLDLFRWLDSLHIEGLRDKPFVQLQISDSNDASLAGPNQIQHGFLIHGDFQRGVVLTLNLRRIHFKPETFRLARNALRPKQINLGDWAQTRLDELQDSSTQTPNWLRYDTRSGQLCEAFLISRACQARGQPRLSAHFFEFAKSIAPDGASLIEFTPKLKDQICELLCRQALLSCGDANFTLAEIVRQFKRIKKGFPESKSQQQADDLGEAYARLDAAKPAALRFTGEELARIEPKKRARILIELLPYMPETSSYGWTGGQLGQSLFELGFDAAPALVEALHDTRPTRAIAVDRGFGSLPKVRRVGEAALWVLNRLSGSTISGGASTASEPFPFMSARPQADAWWRSASAKGEKTYLVESVTRAGNGSADHFSLLMKRFPEEGFAAIKSVITSAEEPKSFIYALSGFETPEALHLVRSVAPRVADPHVLLALARRIATQDSKEAVQVIQQFLSRKPSQMESATWVIAAFLLATGEPSAISILESQLRHATPVYRGMVAISCSRGIPPVDHIYYPKEGKQARSEQDVLRYRHAVEELLAKWLDEVEPWPYNGFKFGNVEIFEPRLADLVAYSLSKQWPQRYSFNMVASPFEMEHQRIRILNAFLRSRKLPERPLPKRVNALALRSGERKRLVPPDLSEQEFGKAESLIESQGLGALPDLLAQMKSVRAPQVRTMLARLSSRLANTVRDAHITVDKEVDTYLARHWGDLKEKSLTGAQITGLLRHTIEHWTEELGHVHISVLRENDLSGIVLNVEYRSSLGPSSGAVWSPRERVARGLQTLRHVGGGGSNSRNVPEAIGLTQFGIAAAKALEASPKEVVRIEYTLTRPNPWSERN